VNWFNILKWDPAPLQELSIVCSTKQKQLQATTDSLVTKLNGLTGTGRTVTAVQNQLRKRIKSIEEQVNYLIGLSEIASEGAQGIAEIKADVEDIKQLAASLSVHINTNGIASFIDSVFREVGEMITDPLAGLKRAAIITQRINDVIKQADALEAELAGMIDSLNAGTFDNGVNYSATARSRPSLPPADASEQQVAAWWSSLSDKDKEWLIQKYPEKIGNLDGVDFTSRDKANQIALPEQLSKAEKELAEYEATHAPSMFDFEHDRLKKRVEALRTIKQTLNKPTGGVPRYLVALDTSGPNVLAAVSRNNPDTADHIGVIVPGMTTNVASSLDDYDDKAKVMHDEAAKKNNGSVAIIEYLNYDAPQHVTVASTHQAEVGAGRLAGFLTGMDASREHGKGDAHITVASHSYGSTTAGIAATKVPGGVIDDLVQFGSPGSGVQDVAELHVPKGHAWVSTAPYMHDVIQGIGPDITFGKNPGTMPGYRQLSGDVGPTLPVSTFIGEHSSYFKAGTGALNDISSVVAGVKQ
jgi:hypothetical protein